MSRNRQRLAPLSVLVATLLAVTAPYSLAQNPSIPDSGYCPTACDLQHKCIDVTVGACNGSNERQVCIEFDRTGECYKLADTSTFSQVCPAQGSVVSPWYVLLLLLLLLFPSSCACLRASVAPFRPCWTCAHTYIHAYTYAWCVWLVAPRVALSMDLKAHRPIRVECSSCFLSYYRSFGQPSIIVFTVAHATLGPKAMIYRVIAVLKRHR
jgi:hypothetical protein